MESRTARPVLDAARFRLASRVAAPLVGQTRADDATLAAVAILTADADPARADRLRPRAGEPAPLVERLAMWALPRASDGAVARAHEVLDPNLHASTAHLVR